MSSAQRLAVIPLLGTLQVVTPDNGLTILLVVIITVTQGRARLAGNLADDRRIGAGSSGHFREGRSRGQVLTSMRRGAGESTLAPRSARITVVASPLASQPGLSESRPSCAMLRASHSCIGPAPSSGSASKNTCPKSHSCATGYVGRLCIPCRPAAVSSIR
jgi:hypothetical protein